VRIGAIAAPKNIPFNTRVAISQSITLKGKSYDFNYQGTVLDRGGAINTASKLPRLDIYMGSGQKVSVHSIYCHTITRESGDYHFPYRLSRLIVPVTKELTHGLGFLDFQNAITFEPFKL